MLARRGRRAAPTVAVLGLAALLLAGCFQSSGQQSPQATVMSYFQAAIDGNQTRMAAVMSPMDTDLIQQTAISRDLHQLVLGHHLQRVESANLLATGVSSNGNVHYVGYVVALRTDGTRVHVPVDMYLIEIGKTWYIQ